MARGTGAESARRHLARSLLRIDRAVGVEVEEKDGYYPYQLIGAAWNRLSCNKSSDVEHVVLAESGERDAAEELEELRQLRLTQDALHYVVEKRRVE